MARPTMAAAADRYDLYQRAVQVPAAEVRFYNRVFQSRYRRRPMILREDFCGTFAICRQWVASDPRRAALGVDLDPVPLQWGIEHNLATLNDSQRPRLELVQGDVMHVQGPAAEVLSAQNFSFWVFKERATLLRYFRAAHRRLAPEGVLVMDMMGGPECMTEHHTDIRRCPGFIYEWEQERFDPITHDCRFHIHFRFKDGSRLRRAFTYDWRFWGLPEVRDLLMEAGFSSVEVYWEGTDHRRGRGNGVFTLRHSTTQDRSWICYLAAFR